MENDGNTARPACKCPGCGAPLDIVAGIGQDQRWGMKLHSAEAGGFLQAKTIAGAIDGAQKMMRAACREDGANTQTYIESIITLPTGEIDIRFITLLAKKVKPSKPLPTTER